MPARNALVVEDSPTMRQLIVNALQRIRGMRVAEAANGVEALRKLAPPAWFDIILTDVNMPVMDGLKLVQRIRMDPELKDIPIIVITTESSTPDRERALALGASAYISKPIQAPQVIAAVCDILGVDAQDAP
jgi:two-component system, chemotaxis family, chemotaxis protein CheY